MNSNMDDDSLNKALQSWRIKATLPLRFQEQVWQRIAIAESKATPTWWQTLLVRIEWAFTRPALAASYVAVLLLLGLATGYEQAGHRASQVESQARALYVQSVDPYQMPRDQQ